MRQREGEAEGGGRPGEGRKGPMEDRWVKPRVGEEEGG